MLLFLRIYRLWWLWSFPPISNDLTRLKFSYFYGKCGKITILITNRLLVQTYKVWKQKSHSLLKTAQQFSNKQRKMKSTYHIKLKP